MLKKGYSKSMSLGPLMGVGSVDALIPPNALTVVLASIAGIDVGRLLIAGILPGLFMSALYVLYIVIACTIYPHLAPEYEVSRVSWGERIGATVKYLLPLGFIVFMVVGLIFLGVATPTEAAATGAFGSFILAALYGRMKREQLKKSILGTVQVTVMIFMIIIVSNTYSEILAFTGSAFGLVNFITGLEISPVIVVVSMMFTILILGCFMETVAIMMITVPIFMPIIHAFGYDPVWFGIVMLINLETGLLTPPFGVTLFVMKGVAPPGVTIRDIWIAAVPYVVIDMLCLVAVMVLPQMALLLPGMMGMR
jgi:tripartite ATP-independent transporter DctM subunit